MLAVLKTLQAMRFPLETKIKILPGAIPRNYLCLGRRQNKSQRWTFLQPFIKNCAWSNSSQCGKPIVDALCRLMNDQWEREPYGLKLLKALDYRLKRCAALKRYFGDSEAPQFKLDFAIEDRRRCRVKKLNRISIYPDWIDNRELHSSGIQFAAVERCRGWNDPNTNFFICSIQLDTERPIRDLCKRGCPPQPVWGRASAFRSLYGRWPTTWFPLSLHCR